MQCKAVTKDFYPLLSLLWLCFSLVRPPSGNCRGNFSCIESWGPTAWFLMITKIIDVLGLPGEEPHQLCREDKLWEAHKSSEKYWGNFNIPHHYTRFTWSLSNNPQRFNDFEREPSICPDLLCPFTPLPLALSPIVTLTLTYVPRGPPGLGTARDTQSFTSPADFGQWSLLKACGSVKRAENNKDGRSMTWTPAKEA